MPTKEDVQIIIDKCRETAKDGLKNGIKGNIQELKVDFLPPTNFLGGQDNPAIFVNRHTYNLLGKYHPSWVMNHTIAIKESLLDKPPILLVGVMVHETGHAFNVAAEIDNTEANAYLFEIEVLVLWSKTASPALLGCSKFELLDFLKSRLPYYRKEIKANHVLADLVREIEQNTILNSIGSEDDEGEGSPKSLSISLLETQNPPTFFKSLVVQSLKPGLSEQDFFYSTSTTASHYE